MRGRRYNIFPSENPGVLVIYGTVSAVLLSFSSKIVIEKFRFRVDVVEV